MLRLNEDQCKAKANLIEEVVSRVRDACRGTPLFDVMMIEKGGGCCSPFFLKDVCVSTDTHERASWSWTQYHAFRKDGEEPVGHFWVRTEDRLAFREFAGSICVALTGMPIRMSIQKSWQWADGLRANRKRHLVWVYGFFVSLANEAAFNPTPVIDGINSICRSSDPRVDRDLFELYEDIVGESSGEGSYSFSGDTLVFRSSKHHLENLVSKVFADCPSTIGFSGRGLNRLWHARIELPV